MTTTHNAPKSYKQLLLEADARYGADLIRRARQRAANMPETERAGIIRRLEDGCFAAAEDVRQGRW